MRISWVLCYTYDLGKIHSFKSDSGRGRSSVSPRARASLVFEINRFWEEAPPGTTHWYKLDFLSMLIRSHEPLQGSKYPGAQHQTQQSFSAGLRSGASDEFCTISLSCRGQNHGPLFFLTQPRPTREDPGQKHTDGCFFSFSLVLFSKRELYWNEILLIGKILTEQTSKRYFEILIMEKKMYNVKEFQDLKKKKKG